jgi:hypothetical protein
MRLLEITNTKTKLVLKKCVELNGKENVVTRKEYTVFKE